MEIRHTHSLYTHTLMGHTYQHKSSKYLQIFSHANNIGSKSNHETCNFVYQIFHVHGLYNISFHVFVAVVINIQINVECQSIRMGQLKCTFHCRHNETWKLKMGLYNKHSKFCQYLYLHTNWSFYMIKCELKMVSSIYSFYFIWMHLNFLQLEILDCKSYLSLRSQVLCCSKRCEGIDAYKPTSHPSNIKPCFTINLWLNHLK